ncbi:MAG: hypothetical protein HY611_04215 [Elusimicrobia bacterium]|nr:hypothetical protein [Elusimicrobiota bacterium]
MLNRKLVFAVITLSLYHFTTLPLSSYAAEVTPLYNLQVLGGQYFFQGERGNLSGNINAFFAPAIKLDDRWTLLPTYTGFYQGTKQVMDIVGAGTLFQEQQDHRFSFKGVFTPQESWQIKPYLSYKMELLKETKDEKWFKGLFDYHRPGLGVEIEHVYKDPFSFRFGYDFNYTFFNNYTSLESQQALDFGGGPLARELVGSRVVDYFSNSVNVGGSAPLGKSVLEGMYLFSMQNYPNQHIVDAAGALTNPLRKDVSHYLDASVRRPSSLGPGVKMMSRFGLGFFYLQSDQNNYDASRTQFLESYYDFYELKATPGVEFLMGDSERPFSVGLGVTTWYRSYPNRPTQDAAGAYRSEKLRQINFAVSATARYPMTENFSLVGNFQYGRSNSNMDFQQFYRYDYSSVNYLFGFKYDY